MIRNLAEEDWIYLLRLYDYCYGGTGYNYEREKTTKPEHPLDWYTGVFEKNLLTSALTVLRFDIKVGSIPMKCGGIQGVVSKPEYRNKGHVRKLLLHAFENMYKMKIPVSNLNPFKHDYYEKFGYGSCEEIVRYVFDPKDLTRLRSVKVSDNIRIEEVYVTEESGVPEDILEVYNQVCDTKYDYCLRRRPDYQWKDVFMDYKTFCFIVYEQKEEARIPIGYIIWLHCKDSEFPYVRDCGLTIDDIQTRRTRCIREMNWVNVEGKIALFKFLLSHRDQIGTIGLQLPKGEMISDYFPNLHVIRKRETISKTMLRIIDFKSVMEMLKIPENIRESMSLKVVDSMCEWNNGIWRIQGSEGNISCWKISKSLEEIEVDCDCELDIRLLAILLSGERDIDDLKNLYLEIQKFEEKSIVFLRLLFPKKNFNYFQNMF